MPSIFSYDNLYRAYLDCRKHKRNKPDALAFEMHAEDNLDQLHLELVERTYRPSIYSYASRITQVFLMLTIHHDQGSGQHPNRN